MKKLTLFAFLLLTIPIYTQDNQQLGRGSDQYTYYGNYYDYSDPTTLNMKVSVWGYVKSPGKYVIPIYTTIPDLISYAGGPSDESDLDQLRIYRTDENAREELIKINYTDLLHEEKLNKNQTPTNLKAGDILIIPGSPKFYFRDYLNISLSIFSAIISLAILIISINQQN